MFVGNLNFQTTQDELSELLGQAGSIVDIYLPKDRATGRPRGFAFVEFSTPGEAADAIEKFNGHELGGRKLNMNPAEDRPRRPAPSPHFSFDGGGDDGGVHYSGRAPAKPKGSRRRMRARKRSL